MSEKEQQLLLLKYRLTFPEESFVNWCPALGTVLSNDEVKDGVSERGGYPVERKLMKQWAMRITAYADRLLEGLKTVDWPESIKDQQTNWIGRSQGAAPQRVTINGRYIQKPGVEQHPHLGRRSISDPKEVTFFACGGPPATTLEELVRIAGRRWTIEEDFELAKGDCGLDEYEVRSWDGWYRHVTLSLWALAVVTVIRSKVLRSPRRKKGARS